DPESDLLRAAHPTVTRLLATVVTDPSFESAAASALVSELVEFPAACRIVLLTLLSRFAAAAASLVAESESVCPLSIGGECALGTDVLEDRQENFECLVATVPPLVAMLLAPEGDPDAPDITTPRSYAEAIAGPYSSQWQIAMDAEMASWKSTGTYVDKVPPPGAIIVDGMWIFRLKRPSGFPLVFKACYVARGFRKRQGAPREWHDTLRTTLVALGFAPSTADPSLFLHTDTSLPPFYILVYVDDLVFATADTEALPLVKSELHKRHTCTDLGHSLLAPPSDESVEPSGPYPELVGCLMFFMTCTRPDLAYPLGLLARYVAPGRHRKVHWDAAKRVLRYLCSTSGMGLVLGGRSSAVLTGHSDAFWVDNVATQRSSQGYTFSLGSGSFSTRSTRSSSILSSGSRALLPCASCLAAANASRSTAPCVAPCCSPHVAPCCLARRALRQPARRALLPRASCSAAARASRPAAPRIAPCCPARRALLQPARRALLTCTVRALLPTPPRPSHPGARPGGAGAVGAGGVAGSGAGGAGAGGAGAGGAGAGATRAAGGAGAAGTRTGGAGACGTGAGGIAQPRLFFAPPSPSSLPPPDSVLCRVLSFPSSTGLPLQPGSPLPAPSPYTEQTDSLTECRELASRPASPVRAVRTGHRVPRQHPPRVPATIVTDPSFESTAASALVSELVDFAAACRLNYAASLVAESESVWPPSIGGECALGTDALEDRQEDFECLATAVPHLVAMLLAPEGDPDALDIPTPRSYAEAITGPYSSQWQAAMDAEMASWKRPPGSPPVYKARYIARGFS
ncbi:unnamed protein product, partial [Closterium sp. NIES-54]